MDSNVLFGQFIEFESKTFTYLLADSASKEAIVIDPVAETFTRDLQFIGELGLSLRLIFETHLHADHLTSAGPLSDETGAQIVTGWPQYDGSSVHHIKDGDVCHFGHFQIKAIATPGHTSHCMSYYCEGRVFTGDALLIGGTGRTDFQGGCPRTLFHNIHEKLFTLPDDTVVYPGHDYSGFTSSTIGFEKRFNSRVGPQHTLEDYVEIMNKLKLAPPKKIGIALKANMAFGRGYNGGNDESKL